MLETHSLEVVFGIDGIRSAQRNLVFNMNEPRGGITKDHGA